MSAPASSAVPVIGDGAQPRRRRGRPIVAALAVTQPIGYGVLYYAFSVFLAPMARDLHATGAQIAAALTLSILAAACAISAFALVAYHPLQFRQASNQEGLS